MTASTPRIGFIGGGNMARAIIGGLLRSGTHADAVWVIEPHAQTRAALAADFNVHVLAQAHEALREATTVVWAVKPQNFKEAALATRAHVTQALHVSVAAGIGSDSIAQWLGTERVVRTMPNTPALIGKGITALYARPAVRSDERQRAEQVMRTTGDVLWLDGEPQLDAVTALSGSGPAYMFYFMEAMIDAGLRMGLAREQAHQLAVATCVGAGELARASTESPAQLRARVTSKGGTTYAALSCMEQHGLNEAFIEAILAAQRRASELGREFGA